MPTIDTLEQLERFREEGKKLIFPQKTKIIIGIGTCGLAAGADRVARVIAEEVKRTGIDVVIAHSACQGFCQMEPIVEIMQPGLPRITYGNIDEMKARGIVKALAEHRVPTGNAIVKTLEEECITRGETYTYPLTPEHANLEGIPVKEDVPFYNKQRKVAMRNCGLIRPSDIREYIARGGYFSLFKALKTMSSKDVIAEVKKAGLLGRGGAGFSTGKKWEICASQPGDEKYVICNGDEGDPGAFMDRSIMEGDPFSILEGMTIGAYAIGANKGCLYIRGEYPMAIEHISAAIEQARAHGLLGKNIMSSDFSFDLSIVRGAGAFVCGEETGLIASIEGEIGSPVQRPPYPAQSGLWGKPTNINNVETWANIPVIIDRGADWFAHTGTESSKGTKVFSLVGKAKNTGLIEVPMGTTLREIVFDIGEGIEKKRAFKAVQTGGPSGGCIPESLIDLPVDYERLKQAGAMMGSGGLIVMDDHTCMVDVAKYFLDFLRDESCGKCTPCREGIAHMHSILTRISEGEGRDGDIELLEKLSTYIADSSLCQLGSTASNPVVSTLRHFRDEYEEHIKDKRCRAGVCKPLTTFVIDKESCNGCTLCKRCCPCEAIAGEKKKVHTIDDDKCTRCGVCYEECPFNAIKVA